MCACLFVLLFVCLFLFLFGFCCCFGFVLFFVLFVVVVLVIVLFGLVFAQIGNRVHSYNSLLVMGKEPLGKLLTEQQQKEGSKEHGVFV